MFVVISTVGMCLNTMHAFQHTDLRGIKHLFIRVEYFKTTLARKASWQSKARPHWVGLHLLVHPWVPPPLRRQPQQGWLPHRRDEHHRRVGHHALLCHPLPSKGGSTDATGARVRFLISLWADYSRAVFELCSWKLDYRQDDNPSATWGGGRRSDWGVVAGWSIFYSYIVLANPGHFYNYPCIILSLLFNLPFISKRRNSPGSVFFWQLLWNYLNKDYFTQEHHELFL